MTTRDYNECVGLHADKLYRFILKNIRNAEDARDIVQTAFEKLWMKKDSVDATHGKSYLFTVAYHEMIDQIRKRKKTSGLEDQPIYYRSQLDNRKILEQALSKLTDLQRSLILLRDWEGYSYEEIGQITGLSAAQVKVYLHRARLQVRNYVGKLEDVIEYA